MEKLTKKQREILERIVRQDGKLLELQLLASGGSNDRILSALIAAGYARYADHPTVVDRWNKSPARAIAPTDAGKAAVKA